jgi:bacterial leucyl aminopeptidase
MTEGDKLRLKKAGSDFMDITDNQLLGAVNALRVRPQQAYDFDATAADEVDRLMLGLDDAVDYLKADITKLSSFWTRSYRSQWGVLSSNWIHSQVSEVLRACLPLNTKLTLLQILSKSNLNTSVTKFAHSFPQNSVIAHLQHPDAPRNQSELSVIIVGAHQDSLNYQLPFFRAPGADDDGSGSVTILHTLRTLVKKQFTPPKDVAFEFHWYAAEEGGLLGSQDIAAAYEKAGVNVKGMLQMDSQCMLPSHSL